MNDSKNNANRITDALNIIGTQTDCQCQGENCVFCQLRRVLGGTNLGIARYRCELAQTLNERDRLREFKNMVHATFDDCKIPKFHGEDCRIRLRLSVVRELLNRARDVSAAIATAKGWVEGKQS